MTQEELAASAGLNVRSIRKIESGRVSSPRPGTVRLLADAFGLAAADRERFCQSAAAVTPTTPAPARSRVPAQLPPDVPGFTGRHAQLATLESLLAEAGGQPNAVVISAVSGTAGVGKTALATHWAHRVADRFPDGQLYINLHGYDPDQPVTPADALARFLNTLGIAAQDIPDDLDERAARYRSELAGRRMLIVLDNAGTVEQVRPLLPGSGSSIVVVTSRDRLAGLVAVHGAQRLDLDLLPQNEALTLLRRLIGPRVEADPEAAAMLVKQCARLPLALRIAAEQAASRPTVPLADLVAELDDQQRRLDLLDAGDPYAAVRTVFSWSTRHLPPDAGATFRMLGLHPGPDIDPYATAALARATLADAERRLEILSRAHLVQPTGRGRYDMHDLLRAYAADLAHTQDAEQVRHVALSGLFDHYRHTASVAMDTAYPYERERRPRVPPAGTPSPDLSDPDRATGWLDREHPNLLAAARHATEHGWPEHTLDLSATLHRHLRTRGRYRDAESLHYNALTTARTMGDRTGELTAHTDLGWVHLLQGRYEQALDHDQQALGIARACGNRAGELIALNGIAHTHRMQGRYGAATDHYEQALQIAHATGDSAGELDVLRGIGHIHLLQGRYEQALEHNQQLLKLARATGNRTGELSALNGIAHTHRAQGRHESATDHYQQLLDLATETGDRNWQFEARQGLGRLHHATGSPGAALTQHRQALQLATELGQPPDQARAHDGLAHAHHALHQPEPARRHWQQALRIITSLGTDRTEDQQVNTSTIRTHLAAVAPPARSGRIGQRRQTMTGDLS